MYPITAAFKITFSTSPALDAYAPIFHRQNILVMYRPPRTPWLYVLAEPKVMYGCFLYRTTLKEHGPQALHLILRHDGLMICRACSYRYSLWALLLVTIELVPGLKAFGIGTLCQSFESFVELRTVMETMCSIVAEHLCRHSYVSLSIKQTGEQARYGSLSLHY